MRFLGLSEGRHNRRYRSAGGAVVITACCVFLVSGGCDGIPLDGGVYVPTVIDDQGGEGADGVVVADMNGDDVPDAVSAWEGSDRVRLHLQSADGGWQNITIAQGQEVGGVEDVAVGDLDGDGLPDVVAACESGVLTWIRQVGELVFDSAVIPASADAGCGSWIDVELADFDGDGRVEPAAACKGGGAVSVFHAAGEVDGPGSFVRFDVATQGRDKTSCVRPADIDGDGDLDIVSAAREEATDSIVWHENPGGAEAFASSWSRHPVGHWPDTIWLDVGDIDGDGRADIAASSWDRASFAWFRNPGPAEAAGGWAAYSVGSFEDTKGAGITIADLDGDGVVELVVGTYRDGRLAIFNALGEVTGPWWPVTVARPGGRLDLVPVVDLNRDGRLDMLTTVHGDPGGVLWYRRIGS